MRPQTFRRVWMLSLGASLAGIGSCTAPVYVITAGLAVAQVGTTAYTNGELQTTVIVDLGVAIDSAMAAQAGLDLTPSSRRFEHRRAVISSFDLTRRSVTIEIIERSSRACQIKIRVGFWGDQGMSRLVLSELQKEMAMRGFAPPPVTIVPAAAVENLESGDDKGKP